MAIFSWGAWSWPRRGVGSSDRERFIREPILMARTRAGREITRETALQTSAILCGARIISQGIAQVPLKLFREVNDGTRRKREPARDHPLYRILAEQPSPMQTSFAWRETLALHAIVGTGGYSFVNRRGDGTVRELIPLVPDEVTPQWDRTLGLTYKHGKGPKAETLPARDVLHLKGPSWDGFTGLSALNLAREVLGLNFAMRDAAADLYRQGSRPSGVLSKDEALSPDAVETLRESWLSRFGPGGEGGVAVLDGGWQFTPMHVTAEDAQQIETLRFLIEEVARYLVIFPQMLMHGDKPTYASVEQFFIAHVMHSLDPWMVRIEQEIKRTLIGWDGDNRDVYPAFIREGLLRGASADRAEFYKAALGAGGSPAWLTQNEVRELEQRNPIDGGDVLHAPQFGQGAAPSEEAIADAP